MKLMMAQTKVLLQSLMVLMIDPVGCYVQLRSLTKHDDDGGHGKLFPVNETLNQVIPLELCLAFLALPLAVDTF